MVLTSRPLLPTGAMVVCAIRVQLMIAAGMAALKTIPNVDIISRASLAQSWVAPAKPDRKSTRLNSSHLGISYAVFCLKKNEYASGVVAVLEGRSAAGNLYLKDAVHAVYFFFLNKRAPADLYPLPQPAPFQI